MEFHQKNLSRNLLLLQYFVQSWCCSKVKGHLYNYLIYRISIFLDITLYATHHCSRFKGRLTDCELWSRLRSISRTFPIPSGAPCALASLFTSVQHCLEMLVHYLVTLSYKPLQYRLHSRMIFGNLRLTIEDFTVYPQVNVFTTTCSSLSESKPEPQHNTRHTISVLIMIIFFVLRGAVGDFSANLIKNYFLIIKYQLVSNTRSGRGMRCDEAPIL